MYKTLHAKRTDKTELFPPIGPHKTEFLDVSDGHRIFVEQAARKGVAQGLDPAAAGQRAALKWSWQTDRPLLLHFRVPQYNNHLPLRHLAQVRWHGIPLPQRLRGTTHAPSHIKRPDARI